MVRVNDWLPPIQRGGRAMPPRPLRVLGELGLAEIHREGAIHATPTGVATDCVRRSGRR